MAQDDGIAPARACNEEASVTHKFKRAKRYFWVPFWGLGLVLSAQVEALLRQDKESMATLNWYEAWAGLSVLLVTVGLGAGFGYLCWWLSGVQ